MAAKSGDKRNFTVACGLLSQLVREKGNIVNFNLGNNEVYRRPTTTMKLLPGADVSSGEIETESEYLDGNGNKTEMELFPRSIDLAGGKSAMTEAGEQEKSQLTIFYGGKVLVFENFPADKAKDLMNYAIKGIPTACSSTYINATSSTAPTPSMEQAKICPTISNPIVDAQIHAQRSTQPIFSDLPIMRKASLQRFMEKRKDRITTKAPYELSKKGMTDSKEETVPWLGLGTKKSHA